MKALLVALSLFSAGPAWAEAVVLSSTAPGMNVGRVLADDENVRLPEASVTTLLLADGRMVKLDGPVEGRAGQLGGGAQVASAQPPGFGGLDVSALGGTRGDLASVPPPPRLDDVVVDIDHPGTWCLAPEGASVSISGDGVLENPVTGRVVQVRSGQKWPIELPIADGVRYVAKGAGGAQPMGFRVIDANPDGLAFRLAHAGCLGQVGPYLREAGRRTTPFALYLTTDRGQAPRYAIGEPVTVILQTNRPARLACALVKEGVVTRLFPNWVELPDHQELRVPGDRVAAEVAATPPPGMGELRCRAVEAGVAGPLPVVERLDEVRAPEGQTASAHLFIRVQ